MKIAIVVHGRFHAFDLARALIRRGNDVTVFTNYPKWAARRFGIAPANVRSCWPHGVLVRALSPLHDRFGADLQQWVNPLFERWAASQLAREDWDAIHTWSGVAEPILRAFKSTSTSCLMMRGSAHIRTQNAILLDEEARTGIRMDRPSPWIIEREEREYELADRIVVLSTFARNSFLAEGMSQDKVCCVPLGANTTAFQPDAETVRARCERIQSGAPLRILYTGLVSLRKGLWDLAELVRTIGPGRFHFQCVGSMMEEARGLAGSLGPLIEFTPKVPQGKLPEIYASADVFLFPTLEDGFAAVLAQANANGLPIVTTTNCCGPELIEENKTGWVVPIRDPQAMIRRLDWCDSHRDELAGMARYISTEYKPRDYDDVAADFEQVCAEAMAEKRGAEKRGAEKRGLVSSYGR